MSLGTSDRWERQLAEVRREWEAIRPIAPSDQELVSSWGVRLAAMEAEVAGLRSKGRWAGGPRTLLHALRLHHDEVALTAGLRWLLDPEGYHGLGDRVLRRFLHFLELDPDVPHPVTVVTEEQRRTSPDSEDITRADLIVRLPGTTILVEAKVWSGERDAQCARLARLWGEEEPVLVFLTRDAHPPESAGDSTWQSMGWGDVATFIEAAMDDAPEHQVAPGVRDYLSTLTLFHGSEAAR